MLGVLPFGEDPDLSGTAGTAVPQHLPPCGHHKRLLYDDISDQLGIVTGFQAAARSSIQDCLMGITLIKVGALVLVQENIANAGKPPYRIVHIWILKM